VNWRRSDRASRPGMPRTDPASGPTPSAGTSKGVTGDYSRYIPRLVQAKLTLFLRRVELTAPPAICLPSYN